MKIRSILAGSLTVAMILTGSLAASATDPHSGSGHGGGQTPPQDQGLSVGQGQSQGQGQNAQGGAGGNGGSSNNSGNGYGGTGNGGAGGTSYGSQQGQGQTAQGGAGGNGGSSNNSGNGYGGSVGNTTANGGSNQNHINTQGGAGGNSSNSGNGYGGQGGNATGGSAQGGSAATGPVTNTNTSSSGGNNLSGGSLSVTDNSKSTYRFAPPQFAPIPGTPGSSTYQSLVCLPNGQVMVVNNQVQGKSDGFNLTIPFVGGGFGYTSTRPSQNSAYWISQSERARVNAELMTADGTASHPLGSLFLSEYTQTSVYATGKARKLNDKQMLALSQKASNAVEATVAKSKVGSVAMGCGRVGGQQVIVAPSPGPAPVDPVQPVEPSPNPIEVPAVPSNPGSIPASH